MSNFQGFLVKERMNLFSGVKPDLKGLPSGIHACYIKGCKYAHSASERII